MNVDWLALMVSLRLALTISILLLLTVLPLAYWYCLSSHRLRPWVDALILLPVAFPPTVLGFYLLLLLAPLHLAFSFTALCIGAFIVNLPIAMQAFSVAISTVPRVQIESSLCLGWSRLATFFYVILPLSWQGVLAGVILCFAHTFGEFGVAMMVGGNISGRTRTMSIAIYDQVQSMDLSQAHQTAMTQVSVSFVLLMAVAILKAKEFPASRR